jgi:hypothetical protein
MSGHQETRSLFARYSLDSSFFIDLWSREGKFPKDIFVGIWEALVEGIDKGEIIAPEVVRDELANTDEAALKRWLAEHDGMFVPLETGQLGPLTEIVRRYPAYANSPRNLADPAVIALAKADELAVLSSETKATQHSERKPKIPNVCQEFDVGCLDIQDFCRKEGIELHRSPASGGPKTAAA